MNQPTPETDHNQTVWHCLVGVAFAFVAFGSTMTYLLQTPDSWHYAALLLAGIVCGLMCLLAWWIRCGDMRAETKAAQDRAELHEKIDRLRMVYIDAAAPRGFDDESDMPQPTRLNGYRPQASH